MQWEITIQHLHIVAVMYSYKTDAESMFAQSSANIGSMVYIFRKLPFQSSNPRLQNRHLPSSFHTSFLLKWTPLSEADSLHYRHSVDYSPHSPFS